MKKTMYVILEKGFPVYGSKYKEDAVETLNHLTNNDENNENFKLIIEEVNEEDL